MQKKRTISILLMLVMSLLLIPGSVDAAAVQAAPNTSGIILNGVKTTLEAYHINDYNFFKLRDFAQALNGSEKQFDVTWDESKKAVNIETGQAYTPVGGEMAVSADHSVKYGSLSTSKVYVDGKEAGLTVYNIGGSNYFKLRDLADAAGFEVAYDDVANMIIINSDFITYENKQYGFLFTLPKSWENYSIINDHWAGYLNTDSKEGTVGDSGPLLKIRNPLWTTENSRQDIPIMVFTLEQWTRVQNADLIVSAAPMPPTELGRNSTYVFALPARYNYSFNQGFEEVESILEANPLKAE